MREGWQQRIRPGAAEELGWTEVVRSTDPWAGCREARALGRPVFPGAMNGNPLGSAGNDGLAARAAFSDPQVEALPQSRFVPVAEDRSGLQGQPDAAAELGCMPGLVDPDGDATPPGGIWADYFGGR